MGMRLGTAMLGIACGSIAAISTVASAWDPGLHVLAVGGAPAVGEPDGSIYYGFGLPTIAQDGTVGFTATAGPVPVPGIYPTIAYLDVAGIMTPIARTGGQVPGLPPGYVYTRPTMTVVHDATLAATTAAVGADTVVLAGGPGTWKAYAYRGLPVPGANGLTFGGFYTDPTFNTAGQIAFGASFGDSGVFRISNGALETVARTGLPSPDGSVFASVYTSPALADNGELIFGAYTGRPGALTGYGIFAGTPASTRTIVAAGSAAPGATDGIFTGFGSVTPSINRSGQIMFNSTLGVQGSVNNTNDTGLWTNAGGNLKLVAREGSQAAKMPAGVTYGDFRDGSVIRPTLNDAGTVAFVATLAGAGAPHSALFYGKPDDVEPLIRQGDHLLGMPTGVTVDSVHVVDLNERGQMLIMAFAAGPGMSYSQNYALIAYDPIGGLQLVAMSTVINRRLNTTPSAVVIPQENGGLLAPALNDAGEFVYNSASGDGNRIIAGFIPEPTMFGLAAAGFAAARRRRHQSMRSTEAA